MRHNTTRKILFFLLSTLTAVASYGQFVVNNGGDAGVGTLRDAVNTANATAGPNTITFTGNFIVALTSGEIEVTDDLVITGNGTNATIIDGADNNARLFNFSDGTSSSLLMMTLRNGSETSDGGSVVINGLTTFIVTDCNFENNTAGGSLGGGAIANFGANLTILDTNFDANTATGMGGSGGAILQATSGTLTITNSLMSSNTAIRAGGAVEVNSTDLITFDTIIFDSNEAGASPGNGGAFHITGAANSIINGGTVNNNTAANEGGGFWNGSGEMDITNVNFTNNNANGDDSGASGGGAIFNEGGDITINGTSRIAENFATGGASGSGGGILVAGGSLTADGTEITANAANRAGGGIEVRNGADGAPATLTLTGVILTNNDAGADAPAPGNGGGVHISGPSNTTISGGNFEQNSAANEGGALWNGSGMMDIVGSTITGNNADGDDSGASGGGGIFNEGGDLTTDADTAIVSNVAAAGASGSGGGLLIAGGSYTAIGTSINNNTANRAGGGIEVRNALSDDSPATLTLTDVNLGENNAGGDAPAPGNGGAIHISGPSNTTITGGAVAGNNAANEGGGLWNGSGLMTISGTQITTNNADGDDSGASGGGGIFNEGGDVTTDADTEISNNVAVAGASGSGGGVLLAGGSFTATGTTFTNNDANRAGGAIEVRNALSDGSPATLVLTDITMTGNNAGANAPAPGNGGGVHISGPSNTTVSGSIFDGNSAANEGGALWNGSGTMAIASSTITENNADGDDSGASGGGGIFNEGGDVTTDADTMITNNLATAGASGSGGGLLIAGGSYTANGSTITGNFANRAGGGIEIRNALSDDSPATLTLADVTLDMNNAGADAPAPGNGGGLHITGPSNSSIAGGTTNANVAASEGGGLWNGSGTMIIDDSTIQANIASGADADNGGGGIFNNGGTLDVLSSTISENAANGAAGSGGGIFSTTGAISIEESDIVGNQAVRAGGGIEIVDGTLTSTNTDYGNNFAFFIDANDDAIAAPGNGGAIHVTGNTGTITNVAGGTFTNNRAFDDGGALWNQVGSTMNITDGAIFGGPATDGLSNIAFSFADGMGGGGAVYNNGGTLNIDTVEINQNLASGTSGSGGGIFSVDGDVSIINSTIDESSAARAGGAIEIIDGSLTITDSSLEGNTTEQLFGPPFGNAPNPGNGGAVHVSGVADVTVSNSLVAGNNGVNQGGGLWNQSGSVMSVVNSRVENNLSLNGAGVYNNGGEIVINQSSITTNASSGIGGGLTNSPDSFSTVYRSTISGNTSVDNGAGIANFATLNVQASTVATNTSGANGGGIYSEDLATIVSSIIALNGAASGIDVSGDITSGNYNLIGTDDAGAFNAAADDIVEADPMVGPLTDNGGVTLTHELLEGSPAYNAGSPNNTDADQIGQAVFDNIRDIGAYEAQTVLLSTDDFLSEQSLTMYPNPSKGELFIQLDDTFGNNPAIQVIEVGSGKVVRNTTASQSLQRLDLSALATGVYVISVTTEAGTISKKLILSQ